MGVILVPLALFQVAPELEELLAKLRQLFLVCLQTREAQLVLIYAQERQRGLPHLLYSIQVDKLLCLNIIDQCPYSLGLFALCFG